LQCNSLFYPQVTLSGVDEDIGHTIVHFLYTGGYETLSSASSPDSIPKEFKRSVQVYCAAMVYGIHGLAVLAKKYVEILGECVPIFDILQATRTVFSRVPDDKSWLRSYIYSKLQGAFLADETAFKSDELYRGFGEDRLFDVTLMRMLTDIYSDTISSLRHEGQKSRADHFIDHKGRLKIIPGDRYLTENLGKIYLDFQRHVVRGIIDQKDKIR
jgi:hypothetical protein